MNANRTGRIAKSFGQHCDVKNIAQQDLATDSSNMKLNIVCQIESACIPAARQSARKKVLYLPSVAPNP